MADQFSFSPGWLQSVINAIAPPVPDLPGILGAYANPTPLPGILGAYGTALTAPGLSDVMDQINSNTPVLPAAASYSPSWQTTSLTPWNAASSSSLCATV